MFTAQFKKEQAARALLPLRVGGFALAWLTTVACAQTLFDGALNTFPAQQGWQYFAFPGQATQTSDVDAVRLDTWGLASEQAGYARGAPLPLERQSGFTLLFTVRVEQEAHGSADRAGFSVIVLGHDQRGIELGFWTNCVFAQADRPLFTRAEEATLETSTAFVEYALTLSNDHYQLRANGQPVLAGPLRDYTAFSGAIDPYETPDFIFVGDDTTSARAVVSIRRVVLVPAPVLRMDRPGVVTWSGIAGVPYTVQTTSDLVTWTPWATVIPSSGHCGMTNALGSRLTFFRVVGP